ncbi:MAG: hypothetical protein U0Q03_03345 [Acidimicrobiales bacterium]
MSTRRRLARVAACTVALAATAAACTTERTETPPSLVPLVPAEALPVSSVATTTTVASSSDPNSPVLAAMPDTECGYADPVPDGEVTFVVADRLYGMSVDGTIARCLLPLQPAQRGPVSWSPDAAKALVNVSTLFDITGVRASGFEVGNTGVRWEYPDGAGIFSPVSDGRSLARRDAVDPTQRTDVSFLGRTSAAVAHPGGGVRIAAGQAADGTRGVYAATDAGDGARLLAGIADPALDVLELAAAPDGSAVWVLTDNGAQFRIHRLLLGDLSLLEVTREQAPISQLTTGAATGSLAWKVGLCNSVTTTRVLDDRSGVPRTVGEATPLAGQSVAPLGWLDAARLVVSARPFGCDGPGDVWVWNLLDGSALLLVKNVEFPAVRVHAPPSQQFGVSDTAVPGAI